MNFNQIINQFQAEMMHQGITPPDEVIGDGNLHRFHVKGDRGISKNGWYVLHLDGTPSGVYGSWKKGTFWKWCSKQWINMSSLERQEQSDRIKEACKARQKIKILEQEAAAVRAETQWSSYSPARPNHPYLVRKRIPPFCARQCDGELVLPIMDFSGKIWSLQYILENGGKRFLSGGAIKSHFIPLNHRPSQDKKILICEGFATGGTLAKQHPEYCVIAACDAGNLKSVVLTLRHHLPNAQLIIAADDDRLTPDNPGITKGREAAIASGSLFTKPQWPNSSPISLTDFNDLDCWLAAHEVSHV